MGYMTDGLTFNTLRGGNIARLPEFKNKDGQPAHSSPIGADWSLSEWVNATTGEAGELAELILLGAMLKSLGTVGNATKKLQRGDLTLDEVRAMSADELADIVTYLDLLAFRMGINLGEAVMDKWNRVSCRVGSRVRLRAEDWHYVDVVVPCDRSHAGPICADFNCYKRNPHAATQAASPPDPDAYLRREV